MCMHAQQRGRTGLRATARGCGTHYAIATVHSAAVGACERQGGLDRRQGGGLHRRHLCARQGGAAGRPRGHDSRQMLPALLCASHMALLRPEQCARLLLERTEPKQGPRAEWQTLELHSSQHKANKHTHQLPLSDGFVYELACAQKGSGGARACGTPEDTGVSAAPPTLHDVSATALERAEEHVQGPFPVLVLVLRWRSE